MDILPGSLPGSFLGFRRPDGAIGIRNHLAIVPAAAAANTVARRVAALIPGAVAVFHADDGAETPEDRRFTDRVLSGAAATRNHGSTAMQ